jgi:hypothetical protein
VASVIDFVSYRRYRLCRNAERSIIDYLQKSRGRPLTQEEINLSLEQARAIHGDDLEG